MSSSAKTGKALAHRGTAIGAVCGAIVSLAVVGAVAAWVAVCAAIFAASPVGLAIAGAGAISAVAAVAYLAVTGVSIRDLYRFCKQVIQVKEEGLVTVQSLQPVLTPVTPIAGKIGCDEIGDAVGANVAEGGKVAVEDAGTSWGTKEGEVAKAAAAAAGLVALDAALAVGGLVLGSAAVGVTVAIALTVGLAIAGGAYVYKRKTAEKVAGKAQGGGAAEGGKTAQTAIKDAVKAGQLAYAPAEIGEIAPDIETPEQSTSKPPKQEKCQGGEIANEEDWVPVAKLGAQAAAVKALTGVGGGRLSLLLVRGLLRS